MTLNDIVEFSEIFRDQAKFDSLQVIKKIISFYNMTSQKF